jgi:hypothetical protein
LGVLYLRARKARNQSPGSLRKRFDTPHLLFGAVLVWLVISLQLKHLDHALSGDPQVPPSTWERVVQTLSDWGI